MREKPEIPYFIQAAKHILADGNRIVKKSDFPFSGGHNLSKLFSIPNEGQSPLCPFLRGDRNEYVTEFKKNRTRAFHEKFSTGKQFPFHSRPQLNIILLSAIESRHYS